MCVEHFTKDCDIFYSENICILGINQFSKSDTSNKAFSKERKKKKMAKTSQQKLHVIANRSTKARHSIESRVQKERTHTHTHVTLEGLSIFTGR